MSVFLFFTYHSLKKKQNLTVQKDCSLLKWHQNQHKQQFSHKNLRELTSSSEEWDQFLIFFHYIKLILPKASHPAGF